MHFVFSVVRDGCAVLKAFAQRQQRVRQSRAFMLVPLFAWAGYVAPARYLAGRRRKRQDALQRELPQLISIVRAFTLAGMPLERALHVLSSNGASNNLLQAELQRALAQYLARTRGVRARPCNIIVCSGAAEGLSLVAAALA